jgi:iron(III) transport system substrate-binding protein
MMPYALPRRFGPAVPTLVAALLSVLLAACGDRETGLPPEEVVEVPGEGTVVVYVEAPRSLAAPVLGTFSHQTGIKVEAHYREEIGPGFVDLVSTEAKAGRADLLWGRSALTAIALARSGLVVPFRPAGARPIPSQYHDRGYLWVGFAVDPRVIIFNSDAVQRDQAPESIEDLATGRWAGKGAIARIAEGPSAYQAAALFARWGPERGRRFFDAVRSAGNRIVDGNADVRRMVVGGEALWGIVDLDQAICAKRQAEPVSIFFPDRLSMGAVAVPHVAALLRGAPHPAQARGLFGYLFATETAWELGQNDCALLSLLPVVQLGIPKPEWVPLLGALNVMALDNDALFDAYTSNAAYFASWGGTATGP